MKQAVIDIGSNSSRLYVTGPDGFKDLKTTRLSEGITQALHLQEEPMARTVRAVADFTQRALEAGVRKEDIFIYATAAVREADNRDEFAARIFQSTGCVLDIIPGSQEGEIAFLGASGGRTRCAVIDIGGASTEVVTCTDGHLKALSQKIGCVRLKELFPVFDFDAVYRYVTKEFIPAYGPAVGLSDASTLIGVSGTPTTFASFYAGLNTYEPSRIQGLVMPRPVIRDLALHLASLKGQALEEYAGVFLPRADILPYGGALLTAFMNYYDYPEITVSDRDSLEGYLALKAKG